MAAMEVLSSLVHGSLSLGVLVGAIVVANLFKGHPATPSFVGTLICCFLILGPYRWINARVGDLAEVHENKDLYIVRAWFYFFFVFGTAVYAVYLLIDAVSHVS
jgi:hypothetical protein